MLAGGALDAGDALGQTLLFGGGQAQSALLGVLEHIAVGGLFGDGADGAGAEAVLCAEQFLDVVVGHRLIYAGEVQVDVGYLVALEAQKDLEGDVEAVLVHAGAADRAVLQRHVEAGGILLGDVEFVVLALRADVVGRQRVDLGDARQERHQRRADRTSGADDVAVRQRLGHQLDRDHVQRGEAVADDRAQLLVHALLHDLRQRIAVDRDGLVHGDAAQLVLGLGPEGLEGLLALGMGQEHLHVAHEIGDPVGVGNDDLLRLFPTEIGEFLQHLVGGLEVQRRLEVGVLEAFGGQQDGAVDRVGGLLEVDVAGGAHRDAQFVAQPDDLPVQLAQAVVVGDGALADEKLVVADGLHLEIVVEAGDALQRLFVFARQHGAEQLARLAGAAHDQPLAVLLDQAAGDARRAVEVVQMALADQAVQVGDARLAGGQQDDVIRLLAGVDGVAGVQLPQQGDVLLTLDFGQHLHQHQRGGARVVHGAMRVGQADAQHLADVAQLVVFEVGILVAGQRQRVQRRELERLADQREGAAEEGQVELGVVGHQHRALAEFRKLGHDLLQRALVAEHGGGDAGDLHDLVRQWATGVDQLGEFGHLHAVFEAHRTDLDDLVGVGVQAGGLHVQHHIGGAVDGFTRSALDDVGLVLDQIALAAGDQLDAGLFGRAEGLGEALYHAVVGDGDGLVAPRGGLFDQVGGGGAGVHVAESGVQVQLDALFGGGVHAHGLFGLHDVVDHEHHLALEVVVAIAAAGGDPLAVLERGGQNVGLRLNALGAVVAGAPSAQKQLAVDRAEAVGHEEGDDLALAVLGVAHVEAGALAAHGAAAHVLGDLVHGDDGVVDGATVDRVLGDGLLRAGLNGLCRVHGQRLGLAGAGLGDFADAALVVAGDADFHRAVDAEQLVHQPFQQPVGTAGLQEGLTLGAGDADGQPVGGQLPVPDVPVDERHGGGALVAHQLLQQPGGHAQILNHAVAQRRIADLRVRLDHREGAGDARGDQLVLGARQQPCGMKAHGQVAGLSVDGDAGQREAVRQRAVIGFNQFFPRLTHVNSFRCAIIRPFLRRFCGFRPPARPPDRPRWCGRAVPWRTAGRSSLRRRCPGRPPSPRRGR